MKFILAIKKFIQEFPAHFFATCLTLLILTGTGAYAATTYDVTNEPQMNLDVSITGTQTTGIILSAPQLNAADHTFATTTGGILRIRWGVYREDIRFTSASVDSTTKKVTLSGVTRNICPQYTNQYVSCGDGRAWGKGAIVELTQDARLFNLKVNLDRLNRTLNSGAIVCSSTSQPCIGVGNYTTTQRDAFTWNTGSTIIRNTTVGALQWWDGSTWLSIATSTGSFVNATTAIAGKVQIGPASELASLTATGSTGAENVLSFRWIVKNGSGTSTANRVPSTNSAGAVSASLGGTGIASPTASGILMTNGSKPLTIITGGTSGNTLIYNGEEFTSTAFPGLRKVYSNVTQQKLTAINGTQTFNSTYTISSGSVAAGSTFEINLSGTGDTLGSTQGFIFKIGGSTACRPKDLNSTIKHSWVMKIWVTILSIGSSGSARIDCIAMTGTEQTSTGRTLSFNSTTGSVLTVDYTGTATNAYSYLNQMIIYFSK